MSRRPRASRSAVRSGHIAMVGIPAVSHVLPSLEIISELVARGHRVTYANDPAVSDLVASTGAELVPYRSTLPVADNNWPDDPIAAMELFLDDSIAALPQLRAVYDEDQPDVYLYDIGALSARALAERQGRPVVQLSPTFVAWNTYQEDVGALLWGLPGADAFRAKYASWLAGCGAVTTDPDSYMSLPPRALAMIPRVMQPHADQVDTERVTFVGPCPSGPAIRGTWQRPPGAERVLLVSLGSAYTRQPEFYRRCVAAFGGLPGWHVVLQIGKYTDPAVLGTVPANVEVHSWVPQLAILEQADAFVTHAGMGGSAEGLLTGTPMIAVPQGAEQFDNADRLVELGVARRVDTEEATPQLLREALFVLADDPEVARRAAELSERSRAEGGTRRAVQLIEEYAGLDG
ncbi:macrolide family glycosyltransferase [Streptomyces albus]|uniref:macrolide family glycosyltransferase n=1 Tax=Streptomyces sp. NRRL F-5639 TaxID=1463867 RepID=UPI002D219419|nr:macrolide family glycosyltransferase [Streptomyces sp. NRRL F-5639]